MTANYNFQLSGWISILEEDDDPFSVRMTRVLDGLKKTVGASSVHLLSPDLDGGNFTILASHRFDLLGSKKSVVSGGILDKAFKSGKRVFIPDTQEYSGKRGVRAKNRSILIQPVVADTEEVQGVLWMANRKEDPPFDSGVTDLASRFVSFVVDYWERLASGVKPMFDQHPQADVMEDLFSGKSGNVNKDLRGIAELVDEFTRKKEYDEEEFAHTYPAVGEKRTVVPEEFSGDKIKRTYYLRPKTLYRLDRVQKSLINSLPREKRFSISKSYLVEVALSIVLREYESDRWASMLTDYIEADIGFYGRD